ncbi:MAG: DUF3604 domain-containing protein [Acidobacteria bacterium]|nr:DUF3604 domain-containing protein [Acidobacteriota bacterium]
MAWRLLVFFLCAGAAWAQSSAYRSNAQFLTEDEAAQKATRLDVGRAQLLGADAAKVGENGEFTLRFTVGRAGMQTGGGLRIATAHDFGWDMWGGVRLQTADPQAANFLVYRTSTGAELEWKPWPQGGQVSLFREYHPWQTINQFLLKGAPLKQGDWIEIVYGSRGGGSPGVEIQPMDETAFEQKVYVDAEGKGEFLPLPQSPTIRVLPGEAKELIVAAKTDWVVGEPGWVNVWLDDGLGNPAMGYRGAIDLAAEPGASQFRASWTFSLEDKGAHRFSDVRFEKPGVYRVRVTSRDGKTALSNPFTVHETAPEERIVWGDMHTHTKYSDGRGTPDEMYAFGRDYAAIDFCSVSDHAFTTTDWMWDDIQRATAEYNDPGRYVTFLGYEWSGTTDVGGDHNVYTVDGRMPLYRSYNGYNYRNLRMYHGPNKMAGHVEDLFRMLGENFQDENLLVIPHYGGRRGNPEWHNKDLQRGIEVFSDHRRSEDWVSTYLEKGHRVGIVASTDNHSGNAGYGVRRVDREVGEDQDTYSRFSPAERGTALMAVYAESLDREGVFQGIYHRRTYATTGSRIVLRFSVDGLPMGSEGKKSGAPAIRVSAIGTDALKAVRIVRNGKIIHAVDPEGDRVEFEYMDRSGEEGPVYYYLDLVQEDGEKAISSPVWLD